MKSKIQFIIGWSISLGFVYGAYLEAGPFTAVYLFILAIFVSLLAKTTMIQIQCLKIISEKLK